MANVKFLRGNQASLPSGSNIQDGAFYLTQDTNRLYVGNYDSTQPANSQYTLKLLNQTVQIIDSISTLNSISSSWTTAQQKRDHANDIYYISGDNILAIWSRDLENHPSDDSYYKWVQINPQTQEIRLSTTGNALEIVTSDTATTNVVKVQLTVTESDGGAYNKGFLIEGAGGVTVTLTQRTGGATEDKITISSKTYSLTKTDGTTEANGGIATSTITLANSSGANPSTYVIGHGDNITLSSSTNGVTISAKDTVLDSGSLSLSAAGTLAFEVADTSTNTASGSVSNLGLKLLDGTPAYLVDTTGNDTVAPKSNIYSKSQIDTLINGINGMTYKGTVGAVSGATISALPTSGVHAGDTYTVIDESSNFFSSIVAANLGDNFSVADGHFVVGDLLIASGTEDSGVITSGLKWNYIPSGNESLAEVTYTTTVDRTHNTISLSDSQASPEEIAKISVTGQNGIEVTSGDFTTGSATHQNHDLNLVLEHYNYTATDNLTNGAAPNAASTQEFSAITGVTLTRGHVTGITYNKFTPVTYDLDSSSNTTTSSGSTIATVELGLVDSSSNTHGPTNVAFSTSTLSLSTALSTATVGTDTVKTQTVTIDMVWGTF